MTFNFRLRLRLIAIGFTIVASLILLSFAAYAIADPVSHQKSETIAIGSNQLLWERWDKINGTAVSDLTQSDDFPENPTNVTLTTRFEPPKNFGNNFGARARGYLAPPVTGEYTFWIAGDHSGELWLSSDENPANAERIAYFNSPTDPLEWLRFPSQQSGVITLEAGKYYYIEALHKESIGVEHISVAWLVPGGAIEVIDGAYLSPFVKKFENVALDGTATQSSLRESLKNYVPENAIDGNTDGNAANNSLSHTQNDLNAWWEVDLGDTYYIDAVRLWNRTDCCGDRLQNFYLFLSDDPFGSQSLTETLNQPNVKRFYFDAAAGRTETFFVRTTGRYVRVQLAGQNFLHMAEVQVWGTAVPDLGCGGLSQESETGRFSGNFIVGPDANARNGFYAYTPEDTPSDFEIGLSDHFVEYCLDVETGGIYLINTRFLANGGANNSFYVTFDDLPADGIRWDLEPVTSVYVEGFVQESGSITPYQINIEPGQHFLTFYQREDGARLDWIELLRINATPVITNPGNQDSVVGNKVSLQIEASDPDGDPLTYSATALPTGLMIEPNTGLITGTVNKVGLFNVEVTVDDGVSGESTVMFEWTVSDNPNMPPVLTNPGNQTNTVGDSVSLSLTANDSDGDPLTFSATGLPEGLTISETTGLIGGTATAASINNVTVTVNDGRGGTDSESFTWTVNDEPNEPPTAINPGAQLNKIGDTVSLFISASDPDADTLTFSATGLPDGLSVNPSTGEIRGVLTRADTYLVVVKISDSKATTEVNFSWQVNAAPANLVAYLPTVANNIRLDEPNNSCVNAHPITLNLSGRYLHEDKEDWYRVTLNTAQTLQVTLSNFTADGQLIVYRGSCTGLEFLQNNGNFLPLKVINLGVVPAGTYFVRVITDSNYGDPTPYSLLVR